MIKQGHKLEPNTFQSRVLKVFLCNQDERPCLLSIIWLLWVPVKNTFIFAENHKFHHPHKIAKLIIKDTFAHPDCKKKNIKTLYKMVFVSTWYPWFIVYEYKYLHVHTYDTIWKYPSGSQKLNKTEKKA